MESEYSRGHRGRRPDSENLKKRGAKRKSSSSSSSRSSSSNSSSSSQKSSGSSKSSLLSELSDDYKQRKYMVRLNNLTRNVSDQTLREICSNYGSVKDVELINFEGTSKFKGVAYIQFDTEKEAKNAYQHLADSRTLS